MPRNIERDALREQERRNRLLQAGFELFSEKGIENVSLKEVADRANVGVATLYNYYQNKTKLVVAISAHIWGKVWQKHHDRLDDNEFQNYTAYQRIEIYFDSIIDIYRNEPEILKFSSDYKTFIRRNEVEKVDLEEHLKALKPIDNMFTLAYEKAKEDGTVRTDIPREEMYTTITLTMLGMAERYTLGLVWTTKENSKDYTNELTYLKEMLLKWIKTE